MTGAARDPERGGLLSMGPPPRSRRRLTWRRKAAYWVLSRLARALLRALWATYRFRIEGEAPALELARGGGPLLPCFWHAWLTPGIAMVLRLERAGARTCWLISPSVDGELAAMTVRGFGVDVVRGSSTRTGVRALRGLQRAIRREGLSPVILPDGPQGPPGKAKPGVVVLAQLGRAPILPIGLAARRAWRLPTWDHFALPLPFTRIGVAIGAPRYVARELPPPEVERVRAGLELALHDLQERARALAHGAPAGV